MVISLHLHYPQLPADGLKAEIVSSDHPAFLEAESQGKEQLHKFLNNKGHLSATIFTKRWEIII
jgi:hypothetical protein